MAKNNKGSPIVCGRTMFATRIILSLKEMLIIFMILSAGIVFAKGLKVAPPSYKWENVMLGEKAEMPVLLKIINDSDKKTVYSLSVKATKEVNAKLKEGFEELPDIEWVSFEYKDIEILPKETKKNKVYLEIPIKDEYFGKSWMFYIEVKEKTKKTEKFALACYPVIYVQTVNKEKQEEDVKKGKK
jgi:hypothetical protein